MDIDTALLRAFVVTADERHFGRAAERLHLTQQGLSRRIARLETIVGGRLLDRDSRRVALTAAGERLLPLARGALDAVDAALRAVGGSAATALVVDVMYEQLWPMRHLQQAARAAPDLALRSVNREGSRSAVDAVRAGLCDVAFGRASERPWPRDVRRAPVALEPLALLVSVDHPVAGLPSVSPSELAELDLWFPMETAPAEWAALIEEFADDFGLRIDTDAPKLGFDYLLDRTAEDAATATLFGLGMRPPADARLRIVPIENPVPVYAWSVIWRPRTPQAVVETLLERADAGGPPLAAAGDPGVVWLPHADRAWLARITVAARSAPGRTHGDR